MEEIRVFTEEHIPEVAALYMRSVRGLSKPAPQGLLDAFRENYLANPWATPEIPSLVYMDNGRLVGFIGVIARPMEFRGRPIRAATIGLWLVDHQLHRGLAGMKLLRQVFKGPQEFSFNDGVGNEASSVYTAVGAKVSPLYSFNWFRLMRPLQTGRGVFDRMGGMFAKLKGPAGLVTAPVDALLSKMPLDVLKRPTSRYASKQVSAAELLECIKEGQGRESLKPAYSMPSFSWLMSQVGRGPGHEGLRMMSVHTPEGERCGTFTYWATPGKPAFVLHLACHRPQHFTEVLKALFVDAWEQGSSAVKGRAIPQFLVQLTEQWCLFRYPYACVVGYSRDPDILQAFLLGDTALSRLDAGTWVPLNNTVE